LPEITSLHVEIAISARDSSFCAKSVRYNIFTNGAPYKTIKTVFISKVFAHLKLPHKISTRGKMKTEKYWENEREND